MILIAPLLTLGAVWAVPDGVVLQIEYLGLELVPLKADALSRIFATVFAFAAFAGGLFALNQSRVTELVAAFCYAGSAIGVVFAGDLVTLFIFWEFMAIGSTLVIWMGGAGARKAGLRYAAIHFLGGVLLMAGVTGQVLATGSTAFEAMQADTLATMLILAAFLVNAGAPPLSAWVGDAYPRASWSGTVFLSAFTTKTAVYVLIRGFPGEEILIWIGLFMVFYGIIYAILENDMRRILVYSIVNQVGFMVTAVGIGTELALNGAAAHAFVHIIYKALLLMSAGSVLLMTGKSKCTDLGGLFRTMPVSCICGIIGALAISSFPLTSGYPAKSMITSAAGYEHMFYVWLGLSAASAGAFLYVGLKFPWFVFFQKDSGMRPPDPPLEHAGLDDPARGRLHSARGVVRAALCDAALRDGKGLRALHRPSHRIPAPAPALRRARLLPAPEMAEADADHHARCRLVLARLRAGLRAGVRGVSPQGDGVPLRAMSRRSHGNSSRPSIAAPAQLGSSPRHDRSAPWRSG